MVWQKSCIFRYMLGEGSSHCRMLQLSEWVNAAAMEGMRMEDIGNEKYIVCCIGMRDRKSVV